MTGLVDRILGLPGWLVLLIAGAVVFAEDALFVGFVIPGETVALLAGASAKLGHVSLAAVLIVVIVAAIVGDTVGYEIRGAGQLGGAGVGEVDDLVRDAVDGCDVEGQRAAAGLPDGGDGGGAEAAGRARDEDGLAG